MKVADFAGIGDQDREFQNCPLVPRYATNQGKCANEADNVSS